MTQFQTAIQWRSGGPEFSRFCLWPSGRAPQRDCIQELLGGKVHCTVLSEETWPFDVLEFDTRFPSWESVPGYQDGDTRGMRDAFFVPLARAFFDLGSRIHWMMFEGAFVDYEDTFTPDTATSTYAVSFGQETAIALDDAERASPAWAAIIAQARQRFLPLLATP